MADAARLLEIVAACDQNGGDTRQSDCRELDASFAGGGASRLLEIAAAASSSGQKTTPWKRRGLEALQAQAKRTRQMRGLQRIGLVSVSHAAQKNFVDQELASKNDYTLKDDHCKWKGSGSGAWRKRTEDESLRIIFASPESAMLGLAKSLRPPAASRHCTDILFAGCSLLEKKQTEAIDDRLTHASFAVYAWIMDEAKYRMLLTNGAET